MTNIDNRSVHLGLSKLSEDDLRKLILGLDPQKVVQEMLGHSIIKMTLDTYSHVMPSVQREAADVIGKLLG